MGAWYHKTRRVLLRARCLLLLLLTIIPVYMVGSPPQRQQQQQPTAAASSSLVLWLRRGGLVVAVEVLALLLCVDAITRLIYFFGTSCKNLQHATQIFWCRRSNSGVWCKPSRTLPAA